MATRAGLLIMVLLVHFEVAESLRARTQGSQYYGNKGNVDAVWRTAGTIAESQSHPESQSRPESQSQPESKPIAQP